MGVLPESYTTEMEPACTSVAANILLHVEWLAGSSWESTVELTIRLLVPSSITAGQIDGSSSEGTAGCRTFEIS